MMLYTIIVLLIVICTIPLIYITYLMWFNIISFGMGCKCPEHKVKCVRFTLSGFCTVCFCPVCEHCWASFGFVHMGWERYTQLDNSLEYYKEKYAK